MASSSGAVPQTVSALIQRGKELLLVQEQGPRDAAPTWMLPGGRVEAHETPEAALRREVSEETGLTIVGSPRLAFTVQIEAELDDLVGRWQASTYACDAEGPLAPADPDELILAAEWVACDEALERLEAVDWYDTAPIRAFLAGQAAPGARYRYRLSGRRGAVVRSAVQLLDPQG